MVKLDANAASAPVFHSQAGVLRQKPGRDRIMPTYHGMQFFRVLGWRPFGVRRYNTPPTLAFENKYMGRFAIQDLPSPERKPPWERIIK